MIFGTNVMRGYCKKSDATNQVLTTVPNMHSRLLYIGNLGKIDEDRFVCISGRLKEL